MNGHFFSARSRCLFLRAIEMYVEKPYDGDSGMKRAREVSVDDATRQPKRRRFEVPFNNQYDEEKEAEGLVHRCIVWLGHMNPQHRPKTLTALKNALQAVCSLTFSVDTLVVFTHLLLNGVLGKEGENRVIFTWQPLPRNVQILLVDDPELQGKMSDRVSADFMHVLSKAATWINSNKGFVSGASMPVESFFSSLSQICQFKKRVEPDRIIEYLQVKGLLSLLPNDTINYSNLPYDHKPGHYMAFVRIDQ